MITEQQKAAAYETMPSRGYETFEDWAYTNFDLIRALLQPAPQQSEVEDSVLFIKRWLGYGDGYQPEMESRLDVLITAAQEVGRLQTLCNEYARQGAITDQENTQLRTRITELEQKVKELEGAGEWKPIETAPRDCRDILIYDGNSIWIGFYDIDYNEFLKRDVIEDNIPSACLWKPLEPPRIVPEKGEE